MTQSIYHFSCGDSSSGAIGFCANIVAESNDQAVERLIELLPSEWGTDETWDLTPDGMASRHEYISVYFGEQITIADIDQITELNPDGSEVSEEDECAACDLPPGADVSIKMRKFHDPVLGYHEHDFKIAEVSV